MKLFSFKKKKPTNLAAREGKKQQRAVAVEERREIGRHDEKSPDRPGTQEKKTMPAPKTFGSASRVIVRPRITEKATDLASEHNAYAFDVLPRATKQQVAAGVKELYGVEPAQVRMVTLPRKRVRGRRGERGVTGGGKKAYVYLKDGDSIEFV